jgi:deoxyhypusine synthase
MMTVRAFVEEHFQHFNAGALRQTARSLTAFLEGGGTLVLTLAGAMSTAGLGRSIAPMIRAGHIGAISCTGANLEEDVFRLVALDHYETVPDWRNLSSADEAALLAQGLNRVTDVCIPEEEAFRRIEGHVLERWQAAEANGARRLPHAFLYDLLNDGVLDGSMQADPDTSWLLAAAQHDLQLVVPGWEDSTLANIMASHILAGRLKNSDVVLSGVEYMLSFAEWYRAQTRPVGFLQVGGGIAGDFPICTVPMLRQDLGEDVPHWAWFGQISESSPSFGGYSGAPPNEKITWGKLLPETPRFVIESDATLVLPLLLGYVLDA